MWFGLIIGILYILFGIVQIIVGLGFGSEITKSILIPNDVLGGFILVLLGAVFLYGVKELNRGINEGVAYVYVGIFLALIFLVIYLLIMAADAIEKYIIVSEDFLTWTPLDDMKPGIYLGILALIGFLIWRKKFHLSKGIKK